MAFRPFTRMSKHIVNLANTHGTLPALRRSYVNRFDLGNLYAQSKSPGFEWAYFEDGSVYLARIQLRYCGDLEKQMNALCSFIRDPSPRIQGIRQTKPDEQRLIVISHERPSRCRMGLFVRTCSDGQKPFNENPHYEEIDVSFNPQFKFPIAVAHHLETTMLSPELRSLMYDSLCESQFRGTLLDGTLRRNVRLPNRLIWEEIDHDKDTVRNGPQLPDAPEDHEVTKEEESTGKVKAKVIKASALKSQLSRTMSDDTFRKKMVPKVMWKEKEKPSKFTRSKIRMIKTHRIRAFRHLTLDEIDHHDKGTVKAKVIKASALEPQLSRPHSFREKKALKVMGENKSSKFTTSKDTFRKKKALKVMGKDESSKFTTSEEPIIETHAFGNQIWDEIDHHDKDTVKAKVIKASALKSQLSRPHSARLRPRSRFTMSKDTFRKKKALKVMGKNESSKFTNSKEPIIETQAFGNLLGKRKAKLVRFMTSEDTFREKKALKVTGENESSKFTTSNKPIIRPWDYRPHPKPIQIGTWEQDKDAIRDKKSRNAMRKMESSSILKSLANSNPPKPPSPDGTAPNQTPSTTPRETSSQTAAEEQSDLLTEFGLLYKPPPAPLKKLRLLYSQQSPHIREASRSYPPRG